MSERIESLKHSVKRDELRIQKLQDTIKTRKEKIRELENAEILSNLNSLSAQGLQVQKIIAAIKGRDADALVRLVSENSSIESSGTGSGSAFINNKEEKGNEQPV